MEAKELQAIVNPIYTTAKGTVLMLKGGGDPDAGKLAPYLDLSEILNNQPDALCVLCRSACSADDV